MSFYFSVISYDYKGKSLTRVHLRLSLGCPNIGASQRNNSLLFFSLRACSYKKFFGRPNTEQLSFKKYTLGVWSAQFSSVCEQLHMAASFQALSHRQPGPHVAQTTLPLTFRPQLYTQYLLRNAVSCNFGQCILSAGQLYPSDLHFQGLREDSNNTGF